MIYSLAMPIGNALDISLRAKQILEQADIIACEDTRKLKDWLSRRSIQSSAKLYSHHANNERDSAKGLLEKFSGQESLVLVSDAGTPRLSDPGFHLIRKAHEEGLKITPVPGPSAIATLISIAPIAVTPLLFLGFLPPKSAKRRKILSSYSEFTGTIGFYESRHRIEKLLAEIFEIWGDIEIFFGREMTKLHEEFFWGKISDCQNWVKRKKGELTFMVVNS